MEQAARSLQMDPTFGCLLNLCMIALQKINRIVFPFSEGSANSSGSAAGLPLPTPIPAWKTRPEPRIRVRFAPRWG